MDGSIGTRAEITIEFKKKLEEKFKLEVILQDERLTSVISNQVLIDADISRKKRKKKVDSIAATLILQSYLNKERWEIWKKKIHLQLWMKMERK